MNPEDSGFTSDGLSRSFRYTATDGPLAPWLVDGTYDDADGRPRVTSLTIRPRDALMPPNGITGDLLRQIHPARFTDRLKASEANYVKWLEDGLADTPLDVADRYPDNVQAIERLIEQARDMIEAPRSGPTGVRGAPRLDSEHLRNVVRMHIQQIADDGTYGSVKRLADELDKPYNTVKGWIAQARKRNLYPTDDPISERGTE